MNALLARTAHFVLVLASLLRVVMYSNIVCVLVEDRLKLIIW